eukprot:TRINITY_DN17951_c0_g1_i2.p1 TRINITY_DN17951_c0_g1~~TRINITY_DN17951_c0_g1_i2.p1  ORF type:complete len:406 (+),score=30.04 TRINITY_DN17951_c0_g1_i2:26-1243(+)
MSKFWPVGRQQSEVRKRLAQIGLKSLLSVALLTLLRSLTTHFWWHKGMVSMVWRCLLVNLRRLLLGQRQHYRIEIHEHSETHEEYAIWWPKGKVNKAPAGAKRLWVLLPGGMSDGDSIAGYIDDLLRSGAINRECEDWCLFHNPGTGGAQWRTSVFCGLSDPRYLVDFLLRLGGIAPSDASKVSTCQYKEIVVLGFSVGGMLSLQTASKLLAPAGNDHCATAFQSKTNLRFVAVHSPDHLRRTFEAMTRWNLFGRIDVPLALHFWAVCSRSGHLARCPKAPQWPWPPTWSYIRRFTEAAWSQNELIKTLKSVSNGNHRVEHVNAAFEDFEHNFSTSLKDPLPLGRVLRIQNPEDPVVVKETLCQKALECCETWWVVGGGHVMCFGSCPDLGFRLRRWIESDTFED